MQGISIPFWRISQLQGKDRVNTEEAVNKAVPFMLFSVPHNATTVCH